ncbi:hypothetical protein B0A55_08214 [Friedmanniomyces simplex]|uniref:DUF221-domain-containing protein n=1 Tax=Friedmanniomyces simplex TaxID=329884 RepID=A0A4U0X6S0_9PEZI|nr:hypothetical protein B0A55_08214 [Friedmanniomyces simplex]
MNPLSASSMADGTFTVRDGGGHRDSGSTSGQAILAAFIPTFITAVVYIAIFVGIRNRYQKIYAPRTFLGTVPAKDRTPQERVSGGHWFRDFRQLPDRFVLQHNSMDAYLYLRFLKAIIGICVVGCCLTWPILFPIHATGGGKATQLDRLTTGNIVRKGHWWAHVAVAWVFFLGIVAFIAWERLRLIGIRQAYYLSDEYASRLSSRTVLWVNAPRDACQPENMQKCFGEDATKLWAVRDTGDLESLIEKRNGAAYALERAELDLIIQAVKLHKDKGQLALANGANGGSDLESQHPVPRRKRPTQRETPLVGKKVDAIDKSRTTVGELAERIDARRVAPSRNVPEHSAVFVAFNSQPAAHRAYQEISFQPRIPMQDRFLAVQPKEVLWHNLAKPVTERLSKASLALTFVIVFTIFFSIPVGLIGTISNVEKLAETVSWLSWVNNLPPVLLGLLTGLLPPFLVSYFVSYVPKLFRHIAKLSGEPTTPQAELKTQAWYFAFQVFQVFLVTTTASGALPVVKQIAQNPASAPTLLAESLPKASNFYLTYFILQGTASAASNVLNYSDLFQYLFDDYMAKTPREKYSVHAQMKGTPWASWLPKFTNLLVIAIAYSCIAPLVVGFAAVGISMYYLSYRYNLLYVILTKVDTKGEAYKRALQQVPTGVYLAELCLIGLMSASGATAQTALMIVLLLLTAVINFILDRMLRPLELYLGVDIWQEMEVPLLAEEDGINPNDQQALHGASHSRRLGLIILPKPAPRVLSDFFDSIISAGRMQAQDWLSDSSAARGEDAEPMKDEEMEKVYLAPALTSKTPKLWIPSDSMGVAKREIEENKAAGITTTDEGAEIDEDGKMHWDHDFEQVPIFKKPTRI